MKRVNFPFRANNPCIQVSLLQIIGAGIDFQRTNEIREIVKIGPNLLRSAIQFVHRKRRNGDSERTANGLLEKCP